MQDKNTINHIVNRYNAEKIGEFFYFYAGKKAHQK